MIDYWSATTYKFPTTGVKFQYKLETDLYAMAKAKCQPTSLEVSRDGTQFAAFSTDRCGPSLGRRATVPTDLGSGFRVQRGVPPEGDLVRVDLHQHN